MAAGFSALNRDTAEFTYIGRYFARIAPQVGAGLRWLQDRRPFTKTYKYRPDLESEFLFMDVRRPSRSLCLA